MTITYEEIEYRRDDKVIRVEKYAARPYFVPLWRVTFTDKWTRFPYVVRDGLRCKPSKRQIENYFNTL